MLDHKSIVSNRNKGLTILNHMSNQDIFIPFVGHKGNHRFVALLPDSSAVTGSQDRSPDVTAYIDPYVKTEKAFVPRQRFLIMTANDKEVHCVIVTHHCHINKLKISL